MLRTYLKLAFRNLRKHAGYTFINVTGLAAGIACRMLILLFVQSEVRVGNRTYVVRAGAFTIPEGAAQPDPSVVA